MHWRRKWQPIPVFLPGEPQGQGSLVGCSPWGREESDTTEGLPFHFSLSCIGEGNSNPLQCSCLVNPRDEGAWWAAVYVVAQSRTRLRNFTSPHLTMPLPFTLLFWVQVYTPFLCFLSREYPLAFVGELVCWC